ncbi:transcriptional regulator, TetR family [Anaerosporobacter mobilis DSM 15930]|uniref:Transcriptional regulator, TetR family n=1 Tax=Anaerosporobacter mobilis DSM 15930 TaxID=1120996 RepID=A0A1M7JJE9_9FIRM|nr:TetR/AcrR family transcriptional regulator [Anaerosporobacter mobilis]SHM53021.1 transcriptional regulator, TetR family [Anaerosporobacter mobilis DSM 15930]
MVKKRNTETKQQIKTSFTKLLKEKGMDSLTISDIARDATINRGTFYLHYLDKYDLMEKLENDVIEELTRILLSDNPNEIDDPIEIIPYNAILNALYYVKSDFEFIEALTGTGGDPMFVEKFKRILEKLIQIQIEKTDKLNFSMKGLPEDYAREILLSSATAIVLLWIKKGALESPEQIAEMLSKAKDISPYELLV